jgi:anti-sigma factor RsiW
MNPLSISEAELHAYVDAALPEARRAEIEKHLAAQPGDAERLHAYVAQKAGLRELFDAVLDEPLPERLRALASAPPSDAAPARRAAPLARWSLRRIAAGLLVAVFSGAAGWLAHGRYQVAESPMALLPRQAAVAHVVFSPDVRRPVEVGADHEDQLVAWLSKRLGTPVRAPKLAPLGYSLIGGRLLPGNSGPVAQFMYQDSSGQRLTLYLSTENVGNQETAFRFAQEGPINVFYWIDGKFAYALSASIAKDELANVAKAVYDQIERR